MRVKLTEENIMGILEELAKQKKGIDIHEVAVFADNAQKALKEATQALDELQVKQRELKEENLTMATVNALMSKIGGFEAKFDTLVDYLKLSAQTLERENILLDKIEGELLGTN